MREEDWELCKELARFLAALDETGDTLREAVRMANGRIAAGITHGEEGVGGSLAARLDVPQLANGGSGSGYASGSGSGQGSKPGSPGGSENVSGGDYSGCSIREDSAEYSDADTEK